MDAKLVPVKVELMEGKKRPKAHAHYRNSYQQQRTQA